MKKKRTIIFWVVSLTLVIGCVWFIKDFKEVTEAFKNVHINADKANREDPIIFEVYHKNAFIKSFKTKEDAINYANKYKDVYVKQKNTDEWIWNSFDPYILFENDKYINDYDSFSDAVFFAKEKEGRKIFYLSNQNVIWSDSENIKEKVLLDVPVILQKPELPRGCEVTSLAMLLNYAGIKVDKMELAKKIDKDTTPLSKKGNRTYFGNPNDGFVGDMYSLKNPGYGVYNGPIERLMKEYMPDQTVNLTGCEFEDLFHFLSKGQPVWAITNTTYKKLDDSQFEIWLTPTGPVEITYKLHAVLITGYDEKYVYFNDPFYSKKNIRAKKEDFKAAWNQMGRQAISYVSSN
ncbi:C39 family peptidase [Defluviitalea raffinosedens]|jgi:uncharacterized protein YvpB|uniref:Peptidase C39-like domain-containing protein n=1 Tax=Defluviitalea raffinosedens TaxID=1450156 RepID=A0A7C8HGX0_9FIRM|nr:C39 family peptidase [Defluviitalea raffinosedens]KAE9630264.1 hypothetical protein GND95_12660 [Defluviitalea raffinosedens]MBM7686067.1 uncharacterized protein YvpB [Defluviitalea raffinosedens]